MGKHFGGYFYLPLLNQRGFFSSWNDLFSIPDSERVMGYQLIETIEVGSGGAASIEFTGIAGTGQDLILAISGRNTYNAADRTMTTTINGSTSDYSGKNLKGTGSSVSSTSSANLTIQAATTTANTFTSLELHFSNYSGSTNKSMSIEQATENNATDAEAQIVAATWAQTAAITSLAIGFTGGNGDWAQYSSASLYMITAD
jgi:hypothetical protein